MKASTVMKEERMGQREGSNGELEINRILNNIAFKVCVCARARMCVCGYV